MRGRRAPRARASGRRATHHAARRRRRSRTTGTRAGVRRKHLQLWQWRLLALCARLGLHLGRGRLRAADAADRRDLLPVGHASRGRGRAAAERPRTVLSRGPQRRPEWRARDSGRHVLFTGRARQHDGALQLLRHGGDGSILGEVLRGLVCAHGRRSVRCARPVIHGRHWLRARLGCR